MGYTTEFVGKFELDKPLAPEHAAYLHRFSRSRRMKRNPEIATKFPDPLREAVGLPIGNEGAYYVSSKEEDEKKLADDDIRVPTKSPRLKEFMETSREYCQRTGDWDFRNDPKSSSLWASLTDDEIETYQMYPRSISDTFCGQRYDTSIVDYNSPPNGQPGLWCQWVPSEDGSAIVWDQGEKFYDYDKWITYLIENFLKPWGYVLNGSVDWEGEDSDDTGTLLVTNNKLHVV